MDVIYECVCGLDVHSGSVQACVRRLRAGRIDAEVRSFGTMTRDLLALADWLAAEGVTHLAMESTGVYWKPIYNILEGRLTLLLVNAQHVKHVPGRKTDVRTANGWPSFSSAGCCGAASSRTGLSGRCAT